MLVSQTFKQSIFIRASSTSVEKCFSNLELINQWLNPVLRCEPIGNWSTEINSLSRFTIQTPFWQPSLRSTVVAREPGLIVWQFDGFFKGCDRWECQPNPHGTLLVNQFQFSIPNPIVSWGFKTFAASWTKKDMQKQLKRLKQIAEENYQLGK